MLFNFAVQQGFNKVALGHHQDDFLTTMLMNLMYEGAFRSMSPAMPMEHYPLSLIRPLCLVPESEIAAVAEAQEWVRQVASCPYEDTTRRTEMERTLGTLTALHAEARQSLWHALEQLWQKDEQQIITK